eukprot:scaffold27181_cov87-Isochrysis_galbana.AAC.2
MRSGRSRGRSRRGRTARWCERRRGPPLPADGRLVGAMKEAGSAQPAAVHPQSNPRAILRAQDWGFKQFCS